MKRRAIKQTPAIKRARSLGKRFSGHTVTKAVKIRVPGNPKIVVAIGKVLGIMYQTVRDGRLENYRHMFKVSSRPLLVSSPDGSQILLIGGSYKFTSRGIVDK